MCAFLHSRMYGHMRVHGTLTHARALARTCTHTHLGARVHALIHTHALAHCICTHSHIRENTRHGEAHIDDGLIERSRSTARLSLETTQRLAEKEGYSTTLEVLSSLPSFGFRSCPSFFLAAFLRSSGSFPFSASSPVLIVLFVPVHWAADAGVRTRTETAGTGGRVEPPSSRRRAARAAGRCREGTSSPATV